MLARRDVALLSAALSARRARATATRARGDRPSTFAPTQRRRDGSATRASATGPRCSRTTPSSSSSPRASCRATTARSIGGASADTFDPFVVGGAGASASRGFKLEIGSATNDIPEGWARAFEGDGDAMPRMRIGGKRIVRIPPSLAYGERGHHCRDGVRGACEVNPGESVEIDFEILRYT